MPYTVSAQILVVAGGGGGGGFYGGGGGGGGVITATINIVLGTHSILVGGGGSGGTSSGIGGNGNDSSFITAALPTATTYLAKGGGAGGGGSGGVYGGGSGGSGGGGSLYTVSQTAGLTNQTSAGYAFGLGFNGGIGGNYPTLSNGVGGGGGGAGAVGVAGNSISQTMGNGGAGYYSSISGSSTAYAGGGGGGTWSGGTRSGTGGVGGGGIGIIGTTASSSVNAGTNTGGGGGGDGAQIGAGTGGSGIVIISYPAPQQFTGGTVTTNSGNIIHTFTSLGSLTPSVSYSSSMTNQGDTVSIGSSVRNTSLVDFGSIPVYDTNAVDTLATNLPTFYSITNVTTFRTFGSQDAIPAQIGITTILADQEMMLINSDPTQIATWDNPHNYQAIQLITPANDPRKITVRLLYYYIGMGDVPGGSTTTYVQTWF